MLSVRHCPLCCASEAVAAYTAELTKWHAMDRKNVDLLAQATQLQELSQATAFESQLCRSLRKSAESIGEAVLRYKGLYAGVPQDMVLPQLWEAAEEYMKAAPADTKAPKGKSKK